ncbi:MAG TPA: hypothetical protein VIH40_06770 [Xanthobacteraceae bacterium]
MDHDHFVVRQNILRYRELLKITRDEHDRKTLTELLADEEAKLARLSPEHPPRKSGA